MYAQNNYRKIIQRNAIPIFDIISVGFLSARIDADLVALVLKNVDTTKDVLV